MIYPQGWSHMCHNSICSFSTLLFLLRLEKIVLFSTTISWSTKAAWDNGSATQGIAAEMRWSFSWPSCSYTRRERNNCSRPSALSTKRVIQVLPWNQLIVKSVWIDLCRKKIKSSFPGGSMEREVGDKQKAKCQTISGKKNEILTRSTETSRETSQE